MRLPHVSARAVRRAATAALLSVPAIGCNELLKATAPQLIEESTLQQATNAPVIVAGAVGDFECAFANYIAVMGTVSDEFADSQANAAIWDLDRRTSFAQTALYSTGGCGGFAQRALYNRARCNTAARRGEYNAAMEAL